MVVVVILLGAATHTIPMVVVATLCRDWLENTIGSSGSKTLRKTESEHMPLLVAIAVVVDEIEHIIMRKCENEKM